MLCRVVPPRRASGRVAGGGAPARRRWGGLAWSEPPGPVQPPPSHLPPSVHHLDAPAHQPVRALARPSSRQRKRRETRLAHAMSPHHVELQRGRPRLDFLSVGGGAAMPDQRRASGVEDRS